MKTYCFIASKNDELDRLCRISNNLYNQTLYEVKNEYNENKVYLNYYDTQDKMKTTKNLQGEINYRLLPAQCSQHILKILDNNYKSFFSSIRDYNKHPEKYKSAPHPPEFRKKGGKFLLIFTNQQAKIKDGFIQLKKGLYIPIAQFEKYKDIIKNFQQIKIIPLPDNEYKICIIYKNIIKNIVSENNNVASMDLGVDNVVTMISNVDKPVIINGKGLKSKNKYYSNKIATYKSELSIKNKKNIINKKGEILTVYPHTSKMIKLLYNKKNNYIKDSMHKISRYVVNYLAYNQIGKLYIGYNKGWKQNVNLGHETNETFYSFPYAELIHMIKYKAEDLGIEVITHEESYTSKCDALALEKVRKQKNYLGKRIKRGLFQSSTGKLINADINGALNILRKNISDDEIVRNLIGNGCLYQPTKFNVI